MNIIRINAYTVLREETKGTYSMTSIVWPHLKKWKRLKNIGDHAEC